MVNKLSKLNEKYYIRVHATETQTVPTPPSKDNPQMQIPAGTVTNHNGPVADKIDVDIQKAGGKIAISADVGSTGVNQPSTPDLIKVELRSYKLDALEQKLYEPTQGFMNSKYRNGWLGTLAKGVVEHRIEKRINREIKRISKRAEKIAAE